MLAPVGSRPTNSLQNLAGELSSFQNRNGASKERGEDRSAWGGEIVAVSVAVSGVPGHDTLEDSIPCFILGRVAFKTLKQTTVREIEESGGILMLLQLLEPAEFVNCKSLRDPQSAEW